MIFICDLFAFDKKVFCLAVCVVFIFACKTSFGMNPEVKKEIEFFWDKKTPWDKCVESTIELDKVLLYEKKFPCGHLSLVIFDYEFYSKAYAVGKRIKEKAFLKNNKTGETRLLKSFEDSGDFIEIVYFDGEKESKELIDKNSGQIVSEKN